MLVPLISASTAGHKEKERENEDLMVNFSLLCLSHMRLSLEKPLNVPMSRSGADTTD